MKRGGTGLKDGVDEPKNVFENLNTLAFDIREDYLKYNSILEIKDRSFQ